MTRSHLCLKNANSQTSEPLISHSIHDFRWNMIGGDIFEIVGQKIFASCKLFSKISKSGMW